MSFVSVRVRASLLEVPARTLLFATVIPGVVILAGFVTGLVSTAGVGSAHSAAPPAAGLPQALTLAWTIVVRNVGVALLLFSGVVTGGLSTLIGAGVVSLYVGATLGAASTNVGFGAALVSIAPYALLEFAALLLAAVSGALPVASVVVGAPSAGTVGRGLISRYTRALPPALLLLGLAVAGLVVAAAVETATITYR
jgi:uncharacterized membrane protein SpoIIM required for sporulation